MAKQVKKSIKKLPALYSTINKWAVGIVFCIAMALYANTFHHEYALDDLIVLNENKFVTQGFDGFKDILTQDLFAGYYGNQTLVEGSRYRPFSLLTFAVEWQFFKNSPHISHMINVFLFALSSVLVYIVLSMLFRVLDKDRKWYFSLAFLSTVLYAAHPLHTEVVANIKGRDEIFSLLFSFGALFFWLRYHEYNKIRDLLLGLIVFFLALLSKENAFTFIAIIPLCIHFFTQRTLAQNLQTTTLLLIPAFIYLSIRHSVTLPAAGGAIKDLMNDSFLGMTFAERYATIFYTLGIYIKLMIFPHPLTYDYYPYHILIQNWSNMLVLLSFLGYVAMAVYAFINLGKKQLFSFLILFYLITLSISSNVFFSIGAFMNERFVFIPSLAYTILLAFFIIWLFEKFSNLIGPAVLVGFVLVLFSIKTISRNTQWKDDKTLTMADVITSSNSAKSNASAGFLLMTEAEQTKDSIKRIEQFEKAIFHFKRAIEIYPRFSNTMINLGSTYFKYKQDYRTTIEWYVKSLAINPKFLSVYESIFKLLNFEPNSPTSIDYKINVLTRLWAIFPEGFEVNNELGNLYRLKQDAAKSQYYYDRARQVNSAGNSQKLF